jgi:hypothetical protein
VVERTPGLLDAQWEEQFEALIAYEAKHGHCNVPTGSQLGNWVGTQRGAYKGQGSAKLSAERIKRLDEIGFDWDRRATQWEDGFAELVAYKAKHGHCNVPTGAQLGNWVHAQRRARKGQGTGRLSAEQIKRLDDLDFVWDPLDAQWEEQFEALIAYEAKHGHCNVPRGSQLGNWVGTQRTVYKDGKLSDQRVTRFEAIGFQWSQR